MLELKKYLNKNQIKENLSQKELLELKELINKNKEEFIENRSKNCYLLEIEKKIKE